MPHGWTASLIVCGFLAGFGLCFIPDLYNSHHGSGTTATAAYTIEFCEASVVLCEDQSDSHRRLLASPLAAEQTTFYEGLSFPPPFPPPRG